MRHLDPTTVDIRVLTFKDGLLSAVAHDLALQVEAKAIELEVGVEDGGATRPDAPVERPIAVRARVAVEGLRVVGALKDGQLATGALSARDLAEIEKNMRADVLDARRFPHATFEGELIAEALVGRLSLRGATRDVRWPVRSASGARVVDVTIDQRDFGITPFKAMMGTLKVRPDVRIVVTVRFPEMH
jgi:hypothetical protein